MYLEAVMVCVNYADFLNLTLPYNIQHFDHITIVTEENDQDTQKVCREYNATCVVTTRLYENGAKFNKGKALNDGIAALHRKEWVLITDADMMMPHDLRAKLESKNLNQEHVYGTSRLICPSHEEWLTYLSNESVYRGWKHQKRRINIGVGFFQLVHSQNTVIKNRTDWYSEKYGHCGRSDRKFWRSFDTSVRAKLKGIVPVHLGDDDMGANWQGRTTPEFQNKKPQDIS